MAEIWGNITGTLSDQTDLQAALDTKSNGLEYVSEVGGKSGWILKSNNGRNSNNPVGDYAIDFTFQDQNPPASISSGAIGQNSFATGVDTLASGIGSFTAGDGSLASGKNAVSFGLADRPIGGIIVTGSIGDYSFTAGRSNTASGLQSTSLGYTNTSSGASSFSTGENSIASGKMSSAIGDNTISQNKGQVSLGSWNVGLSTETVLEVGIGSNITARQNGLEVYRDGLERGSVKAPYLQQRTITRDQTGKVLITKEYLEAFGVGVLADQIYTSGTTEPNDIDGDNGDVYLWYDRESPGIYDGNVGFYDGNVGLYDGNYIEVDPYVEYVKMDNTWSIKAAGLGEAPIDNLQYARTNAEWSEIVIPETTGLEKITEDGGTTYGWRLIGQDPSNYGNIGLNAVDLSTSNTVSDVFGATGDYSMAMGYSTTASGEGSTAMGYNVEASGEISTAMGYNTTASGTYSTAMGSKGSVTQQSAVLVPGSSVSVKVDGDEEYTSWGAGVVTNGIYFTSSDKMANATSDVTIYNIDGSVAFVANADDSQIATSIAMNDTHVFISYLDKVIGIDLSTQTQTFTLTRTDVSMDTDMNFQRISADNTYLCIGTHSISSTIFANAYIVTLLDNSVSIIGPHAETVKDDGFAAQVLTNGTNIIISAPSFPDGNYKGKIYVYNMAGTIVGSIAGETSYDSFAREIEIDSDTIYANTDKAIASFEGVVYTFPIPSSDVLESSGTAHYPASVVNDTDSVYGYSISSNDNKILVGVSTGREANEVVGEVFMYDKGFLNEVNIQPPDTSTDYIRFGGSVDIAANGAYVIGAPRDSRIGEQIGSVYSYYTGDSVLNITENTGNVNTVANGLTSVAIGTGTLGSSECSIAMGKGAVSEGINSSSIGESTLSKGVGSVAMGYKAISYGDFSTAMGYRTISVGSGSSSEGKRTVDSVTIWQP